MNYEYECTNCGEEISFEFTPGRSAPVCSNHDSPAFSDPGDGPECDGPENCSACGAGIDIEKVIEQAEQYCADNQPDEPDYEERDEEEV